MSLGPLAPLAGYRQFIVVRLVPLASGKTDKIPLHGGTLEACDAHNPVAWVDYASAAGVAAALGPSYGVGFVLTANDPFFCLDIDDCALPAGGWSELARNLCQRLPGCVIEVSQSGRGIHVWGMRLAMPPHSMKNIGLHVELYSSLRFILLGSQAVGGMVADCTAIDAVAAEFFPPRERAVVGAAGDGPRADWRGPTDDADLLRRALQSKSAAGVFGNRATFADLWDADETALGRAYPPDSGSTEPYDRSSADAALAQHLAFWTGCDVTRIERLMRASALARPKWDDREDYLVGRTITNACAMQREVLQDKPSAVPAAAPAQGVAGPPAIADVVGNTFLGAEDQKRLFAGCVYVEDVHRVLVPGGRLRRPDQFRAKFGGFTFFLDREGTKTTRNAFEAFTESQMNVTPTADSTCFRPALPYGTLVVDAGQTLVNTYWPVDVPCTPGDPAPFLDLLQRMLPNERDRTICISNAAAIVQYPGLKIPYATLLQGVEGNGKTTISKCLEASLGKRYTYWPKASKLGAQFNSWLVGRLLYLVEDIKAGADDDLFEMLKPLITGGSGVEVEAKGQDQTRYDDVGNFWFNTNHKNGLRKTRNDRRLCMLFCAQQTADDLIRDGLTPEYMTRLNDWLKNGGYAIVTHFLRTYPIPDEFNPAKGCNRAPITSSTDEAIEQSLGAAEQTIVEAIEDGTLPGFKDGWVSSVALDRLLNEAGKGRSVPLNRRRDMMKTLGYDWHPALPEGRTMNGTITDGGKRPRLYVAKGHSSLALTSPADVARAYVAAQAAS